MSSSFHFGRFELSPTTRQLRVAGESVKLTARAFDVLLALIERRERVVTKNELLELVWAGLAVEENNLQVQISALRKILGQEAIATVPGHGYRFAVDITFSVAEPPTPAASPTNNLPQQVTSFIGRETEQTEILDLLSSHRLVTLTGSGGVGKTRISLHIGAKSITRCPDGVWFVDLAPLSDEEMVAEMTATACGLRLPATGTPFAFLLASLQEKATLIILDNCEHLVGACAQLADAIIRSCPNVAILATSRQVLGVMGEQVYGIPSLATPDPASEITAETAMRYGAVRLFIDRVTAANPQFALTDETAVIATEICKDLDGVPLAIELAAPRVALFGLAGLRDMLGARLRVLTGGRTAPSRHHSLRATLDWSHGLLTSAEQKLFRRLGVFVNGFTLELAQVVSADSALSPSDVFEALGGLVDHSLVYVIGGETETPPRYGLLETSRLYALEKLAEAGETLRLREHHGRAFAGWAIAAYDSFFDMLDRAWRIRCEPERENLLQALDWAREAKEPDLFAALFDTLWFISRMSMRLSALLRYAQPGQEIALHASPSVAAHLKFMIAALYQYVGSERASSAVHEAIVQNRRSGSRLDLYQTLQLQVRQLAADPNAARIDDAERLLAEVRSLEDPKWPALFRAVERRTEGIVRAMKGDFAEAREKFLASIALYAEIGSNYGQWGVQLQLISTLLLAGNTSEAIVLATRLVDELRLRRGESMLPEALGYLCGAHARLGELSKARAAAREAWLSLRRTQRALWLFDQLTLLLAREGRLADAARLAGYVDAALQVAELAREMLEKCLRNDAMEIVDAGIGRIERDRLMIEGMHLTWAEADAIALS